MDALLVWILTNWLYLVGAILSFVAAFGFLIFLRGFLTGLNQLLYIDSNAEHVDHSRTRVTWGVLLIAQAFVIWVFIRSLAALFGHGTVNTSATMTILVVYVLVVVATLILNAI